jgi:hypothetical protein
MFDFGLRFLKERDSPTVGVSKTGISDPTVRMINSPDRLCPYDMKNATVYNKSGNEPVDDLTPPLLVLTV